MKSDPNALATKRYTFPSLTKVIFAFVLLGPCLWPLAVLIVSALQFENAPGIPNPLVILVGIPLVSLFGAVSWWWASSNINMWLGTWVPTILAALMYWLSMSSLSEDLDVAYRTKGHWIAANMFICAFVSAATFFAVVGLGIVFEAEIQSFPGNLQSSTATRSWTAFATWVAVVGIIGATLGAILSWVSDEVSEPSFIESTGR